MHYLVEFCGSYRSDDPNFKSPQWFIRAFATRYETKAEAENALLGMTTRITQNPDGTEERARVVRVRTGADLKAERLRAIDDRETLKEALRVTLNNVEHQRGCPFEDAPCDCGIALGRAALGKVGT